MRTRARRPAGETPAAVTRRGPVWLAHVTVVEGDAVGELQWETDRARFSPRARDPDARGG